MGIYVRKKESNGELYAQVVESERVGRRVIQNYICSLGKVKDLIIKLEGMLNG